MKNWKCLLVVAVVLGLAVSASAQQYIGVFFDEEATNSNATLNGGLTELHTAYVCGTNLEMVVGGCAFRMVLDPRIMMIDAVFPPGVEIGTILTGIEIGFTDPIYAFLGDPAILCTLTLYTGELLINDAELTITNHPGYTSPQVAHADGPVVDVMGMTSYLTIPVAGEDSTWSGVKNLYR